MIEKLHDHILDELRTNTRTDTIFIVVAVLLNLIAMALNSGFATDEANRMPTRLLLVITITVLVVVINMVAIAGLQKGKLTRLKLLGGLLKIYEDKNVSQYYDPSILSAYSTRYNLFTLAVVFTGLASVAVPVILLFQ
jgi:hypothetical protein